jgi:hypothetical protein
MLTEPPAGPAAFPRRCGRPRASPRAVADLSAERVVTRGAPPRLRVREHRV